MIVNTIKYSSLLETEEVVAIRRRDSTRFRFGEPSKLDFFGEEQSQDKFCALDSWLIVFNTFILDKNISIKCLTWHSNGQGGTRIISYRPINKHSRILASMHRFAFSNLWAQNYQSSASARQRTTETFICKTLRKKNVQNLFHQINFLFIIISEIVINNQSSVFEMKVGRLERIAYVFRHFSIFVVIFKFKWLKIWWKKIPCSAFSSS